MAPSSVACDTPVTLNGSQSLAGAGAEIVEYQWRFLDGGPVTTTETATITHTYATAGGYRASLVVQDDFGQLSQTASRLIGVGTRRQDDLGQLSQTASRHHRRRHHRCSDRRPHRTRCRLVGFAVHRLRRRLQRPRRELRRPNRRLHLQRRRRLPGPGRHAHTHPRPAQPRRPHDHAHRPRHLRQCQRARLAASAGRGRADRRSERAERGRRAGRR